MESSATLIHRASGPPLPAFTHATDTKRGKRPQTIAHRGYKAVYPENTMMAFRGAVEVGAHAIETDIQISKDGVVVLSHDPTLTRCFGKDERIADCNWGYLQTLRTSKAPHESMPTLKGLLQYLATPGLEDVWVLLDIKISLPSLTEALMRNRSVLSKLDAYADKLFRSIADVLDDVKPSRPWNQRVLIGCWAAKYLPLCLKHFPGYAITHIGFSVDYARQFLQVPGVGLNMFQNLIIGPRGDALLAEVKRKRADRSLLIWTVNEESWMKWCIRREADGVITDDPKKFLEVCERYSSGEWLWHSWQSWKTVFKMHLRVLMWGLSYRYKHGFWVDMNAVHRALVGRKGDHST